MPLSKMRGRPCRSRWLIVAVLSALVLGLLTAATVFAAPADEAGNMRSGRGSGRLTPAFKPPSARGRSADLADSQAALAAAHVGPTARAEAMPPSPLAAVFSGPLPQPQPVSEVAKRASSSKERPDSSTASSLPSASAMAAGASSAPASPVDAPASANALSPIGAVVSGVLTTDKLPLHAEPLNAEADAGSKQPLHNVQTTLTRSQSELDGSASVGLRTAPEPQPEALTQPLQPQEAEPEPEELEEHEHNGVPRIIWHTWRSLPLPPPIQAVVDANIASNPTFEVRIVDDAGQRELIARHFEPEVLAAYDSLIPGAYKADLWRYCVLYVHGGFYADIKYTADRRSEVSLEQLLSDGREHLMRDRFFGGCKGVYNGVMAMKPGSPFLRAAIDTVVENVRRKYYGPSALDVSVSRAGAAMSLRSDCCCRSPLQRAQLDSV